MKYMIRKEQNLIDVSMVMYNIYESDKYESGTSRGYKVGYGSLDAARAWIENQRNPAKSELIEEMEV